MITTEFLYSEFRGRYYPVIKLHIRSKGMEKDLDALIDSGAVLSTFRSDVAETLGIIIEDGERRVSVGITGKVEVFIHELEVKVFEKWFPCKIAFSKSMSLNFNLLGREGFFDKHLITFNEKERKTIITEF